MDTHPFQPTATIYQFPLNRLTGSRQRTSASGSNVLALRIGAGNFGEAWYHEAAIRDAAAKDRDAT